MSPTVRSPTSNTWSLSLSTCSRCVGSGRISSSMAVFAASGVPNNLVVVTPITGQMKEYGAHAFSRRPLGNLVDRGVRRELRRASGSCLGRGASDSAPGRRSLGRHRRRLGSDYGAGRSPVLCRHGLRTGSWHPPCHPALLAAPTPPHPPPPLSPRAPG